MAQTVNETGTLWPAPAKLNLFLHVVGRRPDGYHLLQTLFRFLDFGDGLSIEPRDDGRIRLLHALPGVAPEQDLCWRAARLLQEYGNVRQGVDIRLVKRLPLGGGLGGGSSDAATVLLVLNRLWGLRLDRETLKRLSLDLGADVPVFVHGETAFAEGVGEQLQSLRLPPASYVVLTPPVQVPTASVFAHPGLTRDTPVITIAALRDGCGHNDLQPVAVALYPRIGECLDWLRQFGDARMTGSGSCVFAAFPDRASAEAVFEQRPGHLDGFVADGLDQHPLFDMV